MGQCIFDEFRLISQSTKKCVRIITRSHYLEHSEPLFNHLYILPFKKLVIHRIALLMFKYSIGVLPTPIHSLFTRNDDYHHYNTRNRDSLLIARGNSESVYKIFSYCAIKIWNHIRRNIDTTVSYSSFKHISKHYIQNNDINIRHIM